MCGGHAVTLLMVGKLLFQRGRPILRSLSFMNESGDDQTPATGPLPPGTPGDIQPPADPVSPRPIHPHIHKPKDPTRSAFVRASLIAAVLGTGSFFLAAIFAAAGAAAVQPFIFLLMIATGGLAVTLYTHRVHSGLTAGKGFRLGLLTGFFGAVMTLAISLLGLISQNSRAEFRRMVVEALNNSAAASPDPSAHEVATRMAASINTNGGLLLFLLLMIAFVSAIYLLLAGTGGAVGAALFGRTPQPEK
jgi:uncharacterized membrane protein